MSLKKFIYAIYNYIYIVEKQVNRATLTLAIASLIFTKATKQSNTSKIAHFVSIFVSIFYQFL